MQPGDLIIVERLDATTTVSFKALAALYAARSPYQQIEVYDTVDLGKVLRLDGHCMTSERDEHFYHEALVHPAALAHPAPRRALIVGGGDGGAAEELLKHAAVEKLTLVEIDAAVIEVARRYFASVHRNVFDNPRLELCIADGRAFLLRCHEHYDLIVLDLSDPVGPAQTLFEEGFLRYCRSALAPGGILAMHVESPWSDPALCARIVSSLRRVFAIVRPYTTFVPLFGTVLGMAAASDALDAANLAPSTVERRLAERGVGDLRYYNGGVHRAGFALPGYMAELLAPEAADVYAATLRRVRRHGGGERRQRETV